MTWLVAQLFGRLPIGWLQLRHHRGRLAAAVTGVAFANMLVFVQLGISSSMNDVIRKSYTPFRAHIIISAANISSLNDGTTLPRRIMYKALAEPGVEAATPLYMSQVSWKRPKLPATNLAIYALAPEEKRFAGAAIAQYFDGLSKPMDVLIDSLTRDIPPASLMALSQGKSLNFEVDGRAVSAIGAYELGAGFGWDGSLVVSDQTFMRLFTQRSPGTPSQILVDVAAGTDIAEVILRLRKHLADEPVTVRTLEQAIADDISYQSIQMPIGSIIGAGVLLGILVGVVIVYQVLSTDVAAHLRDYATFKALGYSHSFVLGIVFEEALILAMLGFVPGVTTASGIYLLLAATTDLPFSMTVERALSVFLGTFVACMLSGAFAAQRLRTIDPADLF
jgi:putative ABC transport system permease protein